MEVETKILKLTFEDKLKIASLEGELKGIKIGLEKKATPSVTNIVNYGPLMLQNIPTDEIKPLTDQHIKFSLLEYSYDEFCLGLEGVIRFFLYAMTGNFELSSKSISSYYCIEPDRLTFYRYVEGWIKDPKGRYINDILDIMKPEVVIHFKKFRKEIDDIRADKGESVADCMWKEMLFVFNGICNYTEDGRNKLMYKLRLSLAMKLRIKDIHMVENEKSARIEG